VEKSVKLRKILTFSEEVSSEAGQSADGWIGFVGNADAAAGADHGDQDSGWAGNPFSM
jgi:hypothetical protein